MAKKDENEVEKVAKLDGGLVLECLKILLQNKGKSTLAPEEAKKLVENAKDLAASLQTHLK